MDTQNSKLKDVRKVKGKKNNISKINEKMTKLDSDISELYKKYAQAKKERLSHEKNQKSIMNRIKYLEDEEKKMRIKCKIQQEKIKALTKRLEEKKNSDRNRNRGENIRNRSFNKRITKLNYLKNRHHKRDSSEQSLDSGRGKKKINIKNNIIIINNNKYNDNSHISEILLNDKLCLDNKIGRKGNYRQNIQEIQDTSRNKSELEDSYSNDSIKSINENRTLPNYEIVKTENYQEPVRVLQSNKGNLHKNKNKNVKTSQTKTNKLNINKINKNRKPYNINSIPEYKRNNSLINKRIHKPKINESFKSINNKRNRNNSYMIKKNITTIDINKEKNKNKNIDRINKKVDKNKIYYRKEENKGKRNKSVEVRRKKKNVDLKNKKIKIIKRHLFIDDKIKKNYSERENHLRKSKNYTTKNKFNHGLNTITYDFVINDDRIYYNNNYRKRSIDNILDTDSNSLVNKDINQNYIYLKNEEKMKKLLFNNKK